MNQRDDKIRIKSLLKGRNSTNINNLFKKIFNNYTKMASKYIKKFDEYPFHGELQSHGFLIPAIDKSVHDVYFELPVLRNSGTTQEKSGRVDYWINYEKNDVMNFLVELKQKEETYKSNKVKKITKDVWTKGREQIRAIKKQEIAQLCEGCDNAFCVTLMIIPLVKTSVIKDTLVKIKIDTKIIDNKLSNILTKLNPKPNWGAVWINKNKKSSIEADAKTGNYYRIFAVMMIVHLEEVKIP